MELPRAQGLTTDTVSQPYRGFLFHVCLFGGLVSFGNNQYLRSLLLVTMEMISGNRVFQVPDFSAD